MTPVSHSIDVTNSEAILETGSNSGYSLGDFSGDEGLLSERALVVEGQSCDNEHFVDVLVELDLVVVGDF